MDRKITARSCALLWMLLTPAIHAAPFSAGFVDPMYRVSRNGPVSITDRVHLHAARNETEPFQLVISAPFGKPLHDVEITVGPLRGPGGKVIDTIELYRQHYVTVSTPSPFSPLPPGDYPDALIPFRHPVTGTPLDGPIYDASPFDVKAGENQPIWVDLHVPLHQPPGEYRGTVRVSDATGQVVTLPVTMTVWNFQLPKPPALGSDFGLHRQRIAAIYGLDPRKDAVELNRLVRRYYDLLLDHLLSPGLFFDASPGVSESGEPDFDQPYPGLGTAAEGLDYYLGTRAAASYSYAVWNDSPFRDPLGADRARLIRYLSSYGRFLQKRGWAQRAHLPYGFLDEPASAQAYAMIREWGGIAQEVERSSGVSVPLMVTEQPRPEHPAWGTLQGFVDIWVPSFNAILEDEMAESPVIPRRLEAGERLWAYTALSHVPGKTLGPLQQAHPPKWLIDFPPINYRLAGWLAPLYGISGLLYWNTLWWEEGVDVWRNAGNYVHRDPDNPENWGEVLNGEGFLIYPGRMAETGFDGPVASLRLKWLREAIEDFAYIRLLEKQGEGSFARTQIRRFVGGMGEWENRTDELQTARLAMGEKLSLILGGRKPSRLEETNSEKVLQEKVAPLIHPLWLR